jgi:antitoxin FitA
MRCACLHVMRMNKHIQIRNVPQSLHRKLKMRAASQDMTLTDYLLHVIKREAETLSNAEIAARARKLPAIGKNIDIAAWVREDRDSH